MDLPFFKALSMHTVPDWVSRSDSAFSRGLCQQARVPVHGRGGGGGRRAGNLEPIVLKPNSGLINVPSVQNRGRNRQRLDLINPKVGFIKPKFGVYYIRPWSILVGLRWPVS